MSCATATTASVNRGELSFRWGLHDLVVGSRGEDKLDDGATVDAGQRPTTSYVIQGRRHRIPPAAVRERPRARCRRLVRVLQYGRRSSTPTPDAQDDCDLKWNVASSGLITVESLDDLDRCTEFGLPEAYADTPCLRLVSPARGRRLSRVLGHRLVPPGRLRWDNARWWTDGPTPNWWRRTSPATQSDWPGSTTATPIRSTTRRRTCCTIGTRQPTSCRTCSSRLPRSSASSATRPS